MDELKITFEDLIVDKVDFNNKQILAHYIKNKINKVFDITGKLKFKVSQDFILQDLNITIYEGISNVTSI